MVLELLEGPADARLVDVAQFRGTPETPHLSGGHEIMKLPKGMPHTDVRAKLGPTLA